MPAAGVILLHIRYCIRHPVVFKGPSLFVAYTGNTSGGGKGFYC